MEAIRAVPNEQPVFRIGDTAEVRVKKTSCDPSGPTPILYSSHNIPLVFIRINSSFRGNKKAVRIPDSLADAK